MSIKPFNYGEQPSKYASRSFDKSARSLVKFAPSFAASLKRPEARCIKQSSLNGVMIARNTQQPATASTPSAVRLQMQTGRNKVNIMRGHDRPRVAEKLMTSTAPCRRRLVAADAARHESATVPLGANVVPAGRWRLSTGPETL